MRTTAADSDLLYLSELPVGRLKVRPTDPGGAPGRYYQARNWVMEYSGNYEIEFIMWKTLLESAYFFIFSNFGLEV